MPRTLQAASVKAWRYEQLINELADGSKPDSELAAGYDVLVLLGELARYQVRSSRYAVMNSTVGILMIRPSLTAGQPPSSRSIAL